MEVFVCAPWFRFSVEVFPTGSVVRNVLDRFVRHEGMSTQDFYVSRDGRLSSPDDDLQPGAIYRLETRLCGGKGGFGSMLRALGAQIEKTTNREACRDLSGRRLRDVNHEKEMAEWLKKQSEREAEKEQRRLERLQRKLAEPKHQFTDREYQQQCLDLQERLEDSVLKGLQVSSSSQVKVDDVPAAKRPNSEMASQSEEPGKKKRKVAAAAACFWSGGMELLSSEEESSDDEALSSSMMLQGAEPEHSGSCGPISAGGDVAPPDPPSSHQQAITSTQEVSCLAQPKPADVGDEGGDHGDGGPDHGDGGPDHGDGGRDHGDGGRDHKDGGRDHKDGGHDHKDGVPDHGGGWRDHKDGGPDHGDGGPDHGDGGPDHGDGGPDHGDGGPDHGDGSPDHGDSGPDHGDNGRDLGDNGCVSAVDLSKMSSVQQLESLGLDVLKQELMSRGLKCGGSLAERAARLFSVRSLTAEQVDPAMLAKPGQSRKKEEGKVRSNGRKNRH